MSVPDSRWYDRFSPRGTRLTILQRDAAMQRVQSGFVNQTLYLYPIGFFEFVRWVADARLSLATIGQQQKTL